MRVLLLHNHYLEKGGEDSVFEAECSLLRSNGVDVKTIEFDNEGSKNGFKRIFFVMFSFFNLHSFFSVVRAVKQFNPHVLHIHNLFSSATPSVIWAAWVLNVPIVMTLHNFRLICPSATLLNGKKIFEDSLKSRFPWRAIYNAVYRNSRIQTLVLSLIVYLHRYIGTWNRVSRFIVLSDFARSKFIGSSINLPVSRFVIKPNFVQDRGFSNDRGDEFLFVGRLCVEKGIHVLIDAFSRGGHKITIIGDGVLRAEFANSSNFHVMGGLPPKAVFEYMSHSRALVFPSIWYEGMPMVILESFAAGMPVIASRLGTMQEIVEDGVNGLLFDPNNPDDLTAKLDWAKAHPEEMIRFGINARRAYEEKYCSSINYNNLINIYKEAMHFCSRDIAS